jgi:hypothetical protein
MKYCCKKFRKAHRQGGLVFLELKKGPQWCVYHGDDVVLWNLHYCPWCQTVLPPADVRVHTWQSALTRK